MEELGEEENMARDVNWVKIRNEYITTRKSQKEVASKYHVSTRAVSEMAVKEKWVEQREAFEKETSSKMLKESQRKIVEEAGNLTAIYAQIKTGILKRVAQRIQDVDIEDADLRRLSQIYCDMLDREAPTDIDAFEDDGLITALCASVDYNMEDDSDFLPSEEES